MGLSIFLNLLFKSGAVPNRTYISVTLAQPNRLCYKSCYVRWVTACAILQIEPVVEDNLSGVDGLLDTLQRKLAVHPH